MLHGMMDVKLVNYPNAAKALAEIARIAKRSYPQLKVYTALKSCSNAKRALFAYYRRPEAERDLIAEWIHTSALLRELILQGEIQSHADQFAHEISNESRPVLTHVPNLQPSLRDDEADDSVESVILPGYFAFKRAREENN